MQFVNPNILYALFALLIPILVHLFQLRKFQKTPFTNVKFLQNLVVQNRKSSQLKKWLVLLTRLAVFTCIILAFAQPFIPNSEQAVQEKETVLYIDNSLSLQSKGAKGELLKATVQELLENYPSQQKISLLTNNKTYTNTSIEELKNDLIQLDYSPNQLSYKTVFLKANQLFSKDKNTHKQLLMVSDFQTHSELNFPENDSSITTNLIQIIPEKKENIFIDSAFIKDNKLEVQLKKLSGNLKNVPVSLLENDQLINKVSANIEKRETTISFPLKNKQKSNYKIILDSDDLSFDNNLFLSRNLPNKINVLVIGDTDKNKFLSKVFTTNEFNFIQNTANAIDYGSFDKQHLLVLNELNQLSPALLQNVQTFEQNGGSVLFIPSSENSSVNFLGMFDSLNSNETRLTQLNYSHPILKDVFEKQVTNFQYPNFKQHFKVNNYQSTILGLENQNPLLVQKDHFYVFAAPLNKENSNIKQAPIIVPTLYNIGKNSLKENQLYYTLAQENTIDLPLSLNKDQVVSIENQENNSFIPLQKITKNKVQIYTNQQPSKAGNYKVLFNKENLSNLAYNYSRLESNLNYHDINTIANSNVKTFNSLTDAIDNIKSLNEVQTLWKWFVIFALIFLIIELLILKYL